MHKVPAAAVAEMDWLQLSLQSLPDPVVVAVVVVSEPERELVQLPPLQLQMS